MSDPNVKPMLGRLEQINVRDYWKNEAYDFTPWLALPENLELLGDTIGIELEFVSMEKAVGPFSADILCKNTATDEWVLIENQLEKTDHSHLGQIITYAAGLQVTSIIWIAQRFTEEHRAALDWLNEHTNEKMRFWGVTVELWKIGASALAPKFNIVSRPNEWSKEVAERKQLNPSQSLYRSYWTAFRDVIEANPEGLKAPAPSNDSWVSFAVGKSNVNIAAVCSQTKKWIRVELYIGGVNAKNRFAQLLAQKETIESITGELDWQELVGKQDCRIALYRDNTDLANQTNWQNQHEWLRENVKRFHQAFAPLVKQLQDGVNFVPSTQENEDILSGSEE